MSHAKLSAAVTLFVAMFALSGGLARGQSGDLCEVCGGQDWDGDTCNICGNQVKATCEFGAGFPKAGSKQGEVAVVIEWKNCKGVDNVVGGISKNGPQPGTFILIGKSFSVKGTQQNPLNATGSFTWNIDTGEPTGTVITTGSADAFQGANKLASNGGVPLNVTIP